MPNSSDFNSKHDGLDPKQDNLDSKIYGLSSEPEASGSNSRLYRMLALSTAGGLAICVLAAIFFSDKKRSNQVFEDAKHQNLITSRIRKQSFGEGPSIFIKDEKNKCFYLSAREPYIYFQIPGNLIQEGYKLIILPGRYEADIRIGEMERSLADTVYDFSLGAIAGTALKVAMEQPRQWAKDNAIHNLTEERDRFRTFADQVFRAENGMRIEGIPGMTFHIRDPFMANRIADTLELNRQLSRTAAMLEARANTLAVGQVAGSIGDSIPDELTRTVDQLAGYQENLNRTLVNVPNNASTSFSNGDGSQRESQTSGIENLIALPPLPPLSEIENGVYKPKEQTSVPARPRSVSTSKLDVSYTGDFGPRKTRFFSDPAKYGATEGNGSSNKK